MRVLVTGGAGFIGSHVAEACLAAGHEVLVIDDLSSGKPENVARGARFEQCDTRTPRATADIESFRPQALVHHAAQMSVTRSVAEPSFDAEVNVLGLINLVEAGRGTSTPRGDVVETIATKTVFGEHARRLALSCTKSMTGHLLGASGGLEAGIAVLAVRDQVLPPTINHDEPDPESDLDCVPNRMRELRVDVALNNAYAFGGNNSCVAFARVES